MGPKKIMSTKTKEIRSLSKTRSQPKEMEGEQKEEKPNQILVKP
jgi:hypothetical protein